MARKIPIEEQKELLIGLENEALTAMMNVRYAVDAAEDPKPRDLRVLSTVGQAIIDHVKRIRDQQNKEEEEYRRDNFD